MKINKNILMDLAQTKNKNQVLLIGIGIFGWLAIVSFAYLFEQIAKDVFLHFSLSSICIKWATELIQFLTCILGIIFLIEIVKKSSKTEFVLLRNVFILLLLGQMLQFIEPLISAEFFNDTFSANSYKYRDNINDSNFYLTLPAIFEILKYIVIAIIIILRKK